MPPTSVILISLVITLEEARDDGAFHLETRTGGGEVQQLLVETPEKATMTLPTL